ncbi:MAG: P-loop NTPase, partial [Pseudomonadales bacterium]
SNLAVALAKKGRRVGLLDADIYGPSQPRMMGVSKRPASPDGKIIIPLQAHGVTLMSIGLMVDPNKAVIWRGPMLLTGAIVVSTPQDVALLDARKALDMFSTLNTPVLGMIENMSQYICPKCGHEAHIFGHGGVEVEAEALGLPFLGALPLDLSVRVAGDSGTPVAAGTGSVAQAYADLASKLVSTGIA